MNTQYYQLTKENNYFGFFNTMSDEEYTLFIDQINDFFKPWNTKFLHTVNFHYYDAEKSTKCSFNREKFIKMMNVPSGISDKDILTILAYASYTSNKSYQLGINSEKMVIKNFGYDAESDEFNIEVVNGDQQIKHLKQSRYKQ